MTDSTLKQKMLEAAVLSFPEPDEQGNEGPIAFEHLIDAVYSIVAEEIDRLKADYFGIEWQRDGYLRIAQLNEKRVEQAEAERDRLAAARERVVAERDRPKEVLERIAARPRPSFDERVDYETRILDLQETLAEVANLISKKLNEDDE